MKERGYEVYLIDLEEENLKLPAVYAIIPGILFREKNSDSLSLSIGKNSTSISFS